MKYQRVNGIETFLIGALGIPTYITIMILFYKYDIFWLFVFPIVLIYDYFSQGAYLNNVHTRKYGKISYVLRSLFYQALLLGIVLLILKYSP